MVGYLFIVHTNRCSERDCRDLADCRIAAEFTIQSCHFSTYALFSHLLSKYTYALNELMFGFKIKIIRNSNNIK